MPQLCLHEAHASALNRWSSPHPDFTSGHDSRTSDNALLTHMYGGLAHAANHQWQNAGRRLIDKTYISMLWSVQSLTPMKACSAERISAALDDFIQRTLSHKWADLGSSNEQQKKDLALSWIEEWSTSLFGSLNSEIAASRLLFFLCPALPVFNLSHGHLMALAEMGYPSASHSYQIYAESAQAAYQKLKPALDELPRPEASYGTAAEAALIQQVIDESDWWQRRVFEELLRGFVAIESDDDPFACDDAGHLSGGAFTADSLTKAQG